MPDDHSRLCPTYESVEETLRRFYRTRGFNWSYGELFAELSHCSTSDSFAVTAQGCIRLEHPEFQRKSNVLTRSGEIITAAVQRQARAVLDTCERGIREEWGSASVSRVLEPIVLRPNGPFNFVDKWSDPIWRRCGIYLWTIEYRNAYLASYVGKVFGSSRDFDCRIWEEFKRWKRGGDRPVDVAAWKGGRRRELLSTSDEHLQQELVELAPLVRLWLMPLHSDATCVQAERWVVAELCKDPVSRQFLSNCNPESYRPDPGQHVRLEAPPEFRVISLTVSNSTL